MKEEELDYTSYYELEANFTKELKKKFKKRKKNEIQIRKIHLKIDKRTKTSQYNHLYSIRYQQKSLARSNEFFVIEVVKF